MQDKFDFFNDEDEDIDDPVSAVGIPVGQVLQAQKKQENSKPSDLFDIFSAPQT
jgi:hypothetical protein